MRSILINGEVAYNASSQILNSDTFREILAELIEIPKKRRTRFFIVRAVSEEYRYSRYVHKVRYRGDYRASSCTYDRSDEKIDGSPYYSFPKMSNKKELL
jgi:hypothetical protein